MDKFLNELQTIIPENFDYLAFLKALGILVGGFLILSLIGRIFFGRKSTLNQSVSSAIGILFIYAIIFLRRTSLPALQ